MEERGECDIVDSLINLETRINNIEDELKKKSSDLTSTIHPPKSAPKGFEFSGETRCPKQGEWFLHNGQALLANFDFAVDKYPILCKQPNKAPTGFEFTGEYRTAKKNDWYQSFISKKAVRSNQDFSVRKVDKVWILKPKSKRWIFEETGEVSYIGNECIFFCDTLYSINKYKILKLVEQPSE